MLAIRPLLQLTSVALWMMWSCGPTPTTQRRIEPDPDKAAKPDNPVVSVGAPATPKCDDALRGEKTFYEAQMLYGKKRYDEAAPTYLMSFQACAHSQVLCAAGQAYYKAGKCGRAVELVQKCLPDMPDGPRAAAAKLLASAEQCTQSGQRRATGDDDPLDSGAKIPDEEAPFATSAYKDVATPRAP